MLKLQNIYYHYKNGGRHVLNNVCAEFKEGKVTSIIGPSGSGKTTLLSIMAGLDVPTSGKVLINDVDLATLDLNRYRREQVAIIFQAFQLFPLLTALENVCYPMDMNKIPAKEAKGRAIELLKSVGISEGEILRYPSNLSGGQQQRVAIARALSSGAKVILADEPTGNLDKANSEVVVDILKDLAHDKGYAVIMVTHNLKIADASDMVYRMSDGVISE